MTFAVADRVKETTTVVGTGTATLLGAATGFQSFSVIGDGNTTPYCISGGSEWEVGIGTYTLSGTTLARTTVLASSNAGALVSFSAGTKDVICTYPASMAIFNNHGHFDVPFEGSYSDGLTVDYVSGNGRLSVGGADGIQFYNGGVGSTLLGAVNAGGDWDFNGNVTAGSGTVIGGATNPLITAAGASTGYVQSYIVNNTNGTSSSSDMACYPHNGTDASGWIDMGITSQSYSDVNYSITVGNEGYLFMSAPSGSSTSGNLVIATDSTGTANDIQFFTGGFAQGKTTPNIVIKGSNKNVGIEVASPTAALHLPAGTATASSAPLKLTSGTNLTTAEAGAFEYNGTGIYATQQASTGRGIVLAPQIVRVNTARTKATNNTTLEAVFDAANDTISLTAGTLYYFKGVYVCSTSASGTAAGIQLGFTFSNAQQEIGYRTLAHTQASGTAQTTVYITSPAATTVTPTATTAANYVVEFEGWFKSNASTGGTLIPAFTQSVAGTTVAPTMSANSWFMLMPMSGTVTTTLIAGNWA